MARYTNLLAICIVLAMAVSAYSQDFASIAPSPARRFGFGSIGETFEVQGKVYCDPCRIQFPTRISYGLPSAKVVLVCRDRRSENETYRVEGITGTDGQYTLTVNGDHEEEICEVSITDSPDPKCQIVMEDENVGRVSLTNKNGVKGNARYANPIGFMVQESDSRCKEVLDELGFTGIN